MNMEISVFKFEVINKYTKILLCLFSIYIYRLLYIIIDNGIILFPRSKMGHIRSTMMSDPASDEVEFDPLGKCVNLENPYQTIFCHILNSIRPTPLYEHFI